MGIDFYVDDEQIRLTNAYHYNSFLNWVAEQGEYPQILDHSPVHGSYLLDEDEASGLYTGSVQRLKEELKELQQRKPPEYANYIIEQMLQGCKIALKKELKITMDDGAWDNRK